MNAAIRKVVPSAARLTRSISDRIAHSKPPTMDMMVKPSGPWEVGMAKRQARFNMIMIGGVLFCAASFTAVYRMGHLTTGLPPKITSL